MKKFRVYFEQVNYTMFEVEARTRAAAERKAAKEWRECYREPTVSAVEASEPPKC